VLLSYLPRETAPGCWFLREATATIVIADTGTFEFDAAPNQGWRIIALLTDRQ
jgi:hypothetical protein